MYIVVYRLHSPKFAGLSCSPGRRWRASWRKAKAYLTKTPQMTLSPPAFGFLRPRRWRIGNAWHLAWSLLRLSRPTARVWGLCWHRVHRGRFPWPMVMSPIALMVLLVAQVLKLWWLSCRILPREPPRPRQKQNRRQNQLLRARWPLKVPKRRLSTGMPCVLWIFYTYSIFLFSLVYIYTYIYIYIYKYLFTCSQGFPEDIFMN